MNIPKHDIETAISDLGELFILIERKADKDPYICAMKQYIVNPLAYLHTERIIKKTEIAPPNLTSKLADGTAPARSAALAEVQKPAHNNASPKLLSVANCEGCNRWRKGKRWGLNCTVCVRNVERIVDNDAQ